MEAIEAVSFAASVVSLLDLCCNIVKGSYTIYRSETGAPLEHAQIGTALDDLNDVAKRLKANFVKPDSAHRLSDILSDIKRKEGNKVWRSIEAKWKSMRKEGALAALEQRLNFLRLELLLRLNLVISEEQASVKSKLDSMEESNLRRSAKAEDELRAVQETIKKLEGKVTSGLSFAAARQSGNDSLAPITAALSELLAALEMVPKGPSTEEIVLGRLYFPTVKARIDDIADAEFGTFDWLLEPDSKHSPEDRKLTQTRQSFLTWLKEDDSQVFHISGKAGSGKSTLMKYLCKHWRPRSSLDCWAGDKKLVFANYFFWNSGDAGQKTLQGLYRSLLLDILRQCPELTKDAFPQCFTNNTSHHVAGLRAPFEFSELKRALNVILCKTNFPSHRFCFFIDGLDEFDADLHTDHWDLAQLLRDWAAKSPDVKICVSSRPHEEFLQCFDSSRRMHLHELTQRDVERFARGALEKGVAEASNTPSTFIDTDEFAKDIAERAEGVFLWVRLVVRSLVDGIRHRYSSAMLKEKLDKTPRGLEPLFDQLFNDIDPADRDRSDMVFLLAASGDAKDALMYWWLDDLSDPEFPYDHRSAHACTDQEILSRQDMVRGQLANLTKGLVEMKPRFASIDLAAARGWECDMMGLRDIYFAQRVDFFHRTVQDYLNDPQRLHHAKRRLEGRFSIADAVPRLRLALFKFARTMPCYFRPQGLGQTALIECFEAMFDEKYVDGTNISRFLDECERALNHHRQTPFTYHEVDGQTHPGVIAWGQGWNSSPGGEVLTGDDLSYLHWLASYRNRHYDDYVMHRLLAHSPTGGALLSRIGPSLLFTTSSSFLQRGTLDDPQHSFPLRLLAAGVSPNGEMPIKYRPNPSPDSEDPPSSENPDHTASWTHSLTTAWTAFAFTVAETNMNDFRYDQEYMRNRSPVVFQLVEAFLRHGADPTVSFDLEISRDNGCQFDGNELSVTIEDIVLYVSPPNQEEVTRLVRAGNSEGRWAWLWRRFVGAQEERGTGMKYRRGRMEEFNTEERGYRVKTGYAGEEKLEGSFFANLW
ncbi:hypothetical protein QBC34DRAFT_454861 [Podospora aff. communis PSN243]|uniref:NACHT domain-containing protein n=1 Tax=Podospora aff. communis PSN243 TaxID=3040156 RepID=A0AAV9G2U0_9PEZI|nr:hypothetical protein QBC34DRAFT_454861 [Podospora aff. communis PSN243]